MGTVLILKDGKREIVTRNRHFVDLIRTYLGDDAARYYEDQRRCIFGVMREIREIALTDNDADLIKAVVDGVIDND